MQILVTLAVITFFGFWLVWENSRDRELSLISGTYVFVVKSILYMHLYICRRLTDLKLLPSDSNRAGVQVPLSGLCKHFQPHKEWFSWCWGFQWTAFVQITLAIDDLAWNAFQRYRLVANGKVTSYTRSGSFFIASSIWSLNFSGTCPCPCRQSL